MSLEPPKENDLVDPDALWPAESIIFATVFLAQPAEEIDLVQ